VDGTEAPAGTAGYREAAAELVVQYEAVTFDRVHREALELLPPAPARALDVGAGTGRDAAALAARGYRVLAVEPTVELRVHREGFTWLTDMLPELSLVEGAFELIMLTAVWMHLDGGERRRAMARLVELLAPGGRLFLMVRHGPVPAGRLMHDVSADETTELAGRCGLTELLRAHRSDESGRAGVSWTHLVYQVRA
jgi:SAM-dependent methyltransferase